MSFGWKHNKKNEQCKEEEERIITNGNEKKSETSCAIEEETMKITCS